MKKIILLLPIMILSILFSTVSTEAASNCKSTWYGEYFTKVPVGRFTVQKEPINIYRYQHRELIKTERTIQPKSAKFVYKKFEFEGKTYYQTGEDEFFINSSNIKYEPIPSKIKSCLETAVLDKNTNKIIKEAKKLKSELAKVLYVNDALSKMLIYDDVLLLKGNDIPPTYSSLYLALAYGRAMCSGYATTTSYLLDKLGIENTSVSSSTMNHEWNMVKVDGKWYHLDVTWNDTDDLDITKYHHFLLSDKGIKERNHYGWSSKAPKATSDTFLYITNPYQNYTYMIYTDYKSLYYNNSDIIWKTSLDGKSRKTLIDESVTNIQILDGYMYYTSGNSLWRMSLDEKNTTQLINEKIIVNGRGYSIYAFLNNSIYYLGYQNDKEDAVLYESNLDGSNKKVIKEIGKWKNSFYCLIKVNKDKDNTISYEVDGEYFEAKVEKK